MPDKKESLFEPVEVVVSDEWGFEIVTIMSPTRTLLDKLFDACQHHADDVTAEW